MSTDRASQGALAGKRVLITRSAHQAGAFARELSARGAEPIFAPAIAIEPPDDPQAAHRAVDDLAAYRWLVFTSQNAVDVFFDRLAALDADARYVGQTKVAAIGAKTARRLHEHGVRPDLVPAEFVGEEIARALIEATQPGDRVMIFRAQEARDVLPEMLADAGLRVSVVAAYKTRFAHDERFAGDVARADVITFTSASTVNGFAAALGGSEAAAAAVRGKTVACIGPITAGAARACGIEPAVVAREFTTAGLIEALEAHVRDDGYGGDAARFGRAPGGGGCGTRLSRAFAVARRCDCGVRRRHRRLRRRRLERGVRAVRVLHSVDSALARRKGA